MKAIIYARVSTKDQEARNQIRKLETYAQDEGMEIQEIITDKLSGSKSAKDRPGLNRVMELAAKRKFDVLLFWSLDRFSREGTVKTLGYLEALTARGIKWVSHEEKYLNSLDDNIAEGIVGLLASLAKQERLRLIERTRAGIERARESGTKSGKAIGRPKGIRSRETLEKGKFVKRLRDEGLSFNKIAAQMNMSKQRAAQLYKLEAA